MGHRRVDDCSLGVREFDCSWARHCGLTFWLIVIVIVCVAAPVLAAELQNGELRVSVKSAVSTDSGPVAGVYAALIAIDEPASRPTREAIIDGEVIWRDVPPGQYTVVTEAASFASAFRLIEIAPGRKDQVIMALERQVQRQGTIVNTAGQPVAGATVCHARVATAVVMNTMSSLARTNALRRLCSRTDETGRWKLSADGSRPNDVVAEAAGYSPAWLTLLPTTTEPLSTTLRKGASLRVVTNRAAEEAVLHLVPANVLNTTLPLWAQRSIWGRNVAGTIAEWLSLPAGEYDVVATWADPRRFAAPITLRRVKLAEDATEEISVSLPEARPLRTNPVRFYVPAQTSTRDLAAFVRTAPGGKQVAAAWEQTGRGLILFADAAVASDEVFFTTASDVILTLTAGGRATRAAVKGIKLTKANGTLRVTVTGGAVLPSSGNATFRECAGSGSFVLPIEVAKNGDASLPVLVGCRAAILRFGNFSPITVISNARAGENMWLGTHALRAAAAAEVRVVQEPDGSDVEDALIAVLVERPSNRPVEVLRRRGGGVRPVTIEGLPAGEEIIFRATQTTTNLVGTIKRVIQPAQRAVVDVLLPQPVELTVVPRFEEGFKAEYPDVQLTGIMAEGETADLNQSAEVTNDREETVFRGLRPGDWRILAMVRGDGSTQPVEIAMVTLASGEKRKIEPVIRPLAISGRITAQGQGVRTSLAITDPPAPRAITRRIFSKDDGSFHVMLPGPGLYGLAAKRRLSDPDIQLTPMRFDTTSRDVLIALPEGSLKVRVVSGETPVPAAEITASMLVQPPDQPGLLRLERKDRTGSDGEVALESLQPGKWLVEARQKELGVADTTVTVVKDRVETVTLQLDSTSVSGIVIEPFGGPAVDAAVDCIFSGRDNTARMLHAETDSKGHFSIMLPKDVAERVGCGVTTPTGAIGTFSAAVGSDVRFGLASATAAVTITDWSDRGNQNRYWLLASDGTLFSLSWAARKLRTFDAPFRIARLPADVWSVVRVDSPSALEALARGAALPSMTRVQVTAGKSEEVSLGAPKPVSQ